MALRWSARIAFFPAIDMPLRWSGESRPRDRSYKGPVDGRRGRESRLGEDLYGTSMGFLWELYRVRYPLT